MPPVGRRPRAPLVPIHRPQLAVAIGPFVPDGHAIGAKVRDVGASLEEPEELVDYALHVDLLGREEREALGEVETHLVAEDGEGARAGAIVLARAVIAHVP